MHKVKHNLKETGMLKHSFFFLLAMFLIYPHNSINAIDNNEDLETPLMSMYDVPAHHMHPTTRKNRIMLAIAFSIVLTATTNFTFPDETIGYFTNQIPAELIAATTRNHHLVKKLILGVIASVAAGSLDWYIIHPVFKRNFGLGVAGTQTCIMFLRDWLLEEGLGIRLQRVPQRNF
jgi:hypothetical protein